MRKSNVQPGMEPLIADGVALQGFHREMTEKMHRSRIVKGRHGWHNPEECSIEYLETQMYIHVKKGDMVDVANFAMMIWHRQEMEKPYGPGVIAEASAGESRAPSVQTPFEKPRTAGGSPEEELGLGARG